MSKVNVDGEDQYYAEGTAPTWTNYVIGANADAVKGGTPANSDIKSNIAGAGSGWTTVTYANYNGKYIRTDMIAIGLNASSANKAYKKDVDKVTGLTGNWYSIDSNATYQALDGTELLATSALSGKDILDGYYKVTQKGATAAADTVVYAKANANTSGLSLTGTYVKDSTGAFLAVVGTDEVKVPAGTDARDITIEHGQDGYAKINLTSNASSTAVKGLTVTVTPAEDYKQKDGKAAFTVTITGTATPAAADQKVTVTLANAEDWPAQPTLPTGVAKAAKVLTIDKDTEVNLTFTVTSTAVAATPADITVTATVGETT